jgi:Viral BACON domain
VVDAKVPGVTQFVGSIELQPLQTDSIGSPVATNTDGAGGGGYETCERPDSGPEYNAIHKAPSEIQNQAFFDKLRLGDPRANGNPQANIPYPTIQYMSVDITLPTFVALWEPTLLDTANCRNQRFDNSGNPLYDVPANVADIPGEGFYAFPGFWLPNYANPKQDPNNPNDDILGGTKFEGGISYNCDEDKYALFTEPQPSEKRVVESENSKRWGTPGQKVKLEQYFETAVNTDGYTYITKMTYKVSSATELASGKNNFTFSFTPDPQTAIIGKGQDVQDIVWINSYGLAQDHKTKNPNVPDGKHPTVESGSVVQGLEFSNVMIAGCKDCTPFAWEDSNLRAPPCTTKDYITAPDSSPPNLNANPIKLNFAACTNKKDGKCDSDQDGITDDVERANGTSPFDPNDPGQGKSHMYILELNDQPNSNTEYIEADVNTTVSGDFKIGNDGNAELSYSLLKSASWLSLTPTSGSLTSNTEATIKYDATCPATSGTYSETITINNNDPINPALPVTIALTCVKPEPPVECMELKNIDINAIEQFNNTANVKLAIGPHLKIDTDKPQCGNWVSTGSQNPYGGYFQKEIELYRTGEVTEYYFYHTYQTGSGGRPSIEEQWYRLLPAVDYFVVSGFYLPGSALGNTVESDISDTLILKGSFATSSYKLIESYTLSEQEGEQYNQESKVLFGNVLNSGLGVVEGGTGGFKALPSLDSRNYCFVRRCFSTTKVYEGPSGFLEMLEPLPENDAYTEEKAPANNVTVVNVSGVEIKRLDGTVLGRLAQGTELWLIHFIEVHQSCLSESPA